MKVKDGYIIKKVMGSYMIISTEESDSMPRMQTMNETGAFLWEALGEDTTVSTLVQKLMSEYEVDSATAAKDVEAFVAALEDAGLLEK